MRQKSGSRAPTSEKVVKDIRRATRKRHSSEEKIRIVLDAGQHEGHLAGECDYHKPVDRPQEVIGRNSIFEIEIIE